jgi:small subunit ribosomal protein S16
LAVKIRLARHGAKKRPYYRVVIADARVQRDGGIIEEVGRYNPLTEPATVTLDFEKIDTWIGNGAQPTDTVTRLIKNAREQA